MSKSFSLREQKILLHLAARSISDGSSSLILAGDELIGLDWNVVFEISKTQAISLVTFDAATPYKNIFQMMCMLVGKPMQCPFCNRILQ